MDAKKKREKDYAGLVKESGGRSPVLKNLPAAWLTGGLICVLGQGLNDFYTKVAALDPDSAGTAASMTLIFLAALATGLKLYYPLAKFAGAGTLVPITGFSNAMTAPAMEFRSGGIILGVGVKLFSITGPVIAYGTAAAAVYGLILFITGGAA